MDLTGHFEDKMVINRNLDVHFIDSAELFDEVAEDFSDVKGRLLVALDRERIISGEEFLAVVYDGGRLAGWGWVRKGPLRYGNFCVGQKECVIHKCRTVRCHRRRGVYVTLLSKLVQIMSEREFTKAYIGAKSFNKVSLSGIKKAGFEFIEDCELGYFLSRLWYHMAGRGSKVMQEFD